MEALKVKWKGINPFIKLPKVGDNTGDSTEQQTEEPQDNGVEIGLLKRTFGSVLESIE